MFASSFLSMFSSYRSPSSSLDTLLDQENVDITQVLDDESVVSQLNMQNFKLIAYLNIDRLYFILEMLTVFPPEGSNDQRNFRYPFIAAEIFCTDSVPLLDLIFADQEFFRRFFSFLDNKANAILCGYYSRVFLAFLTKRPEVFLSHFLELKDFSTLAERIIQKAMADLVVKLLLMDFKIEKSYLENRKQLLMRIIEKVGVEDEAAAAGQILVEVISKLEDCNEKLGMVEVLAGETVVGALFGMLAAQQKCQVDSALGVLKSLLNSTTILRFDRENESVILKRLIFSFKDLETVLQSSEELLFNSIRETYEPLGNRKLKVVEIVLAMVKLGSEEITTSLARSSLIPLIVSLFFKHDWNSFLHFQFFSLAQVIIFNNSFELKVALLKTSGFLSQMIGSFRSNPRKKTYNPELKPGYQGVLIRLANALSKLSTSSSMIQTILNQYPEFQSLNTEYLAKINLLEKRELGGYVYKDEADCLEIGDYEPDVEDSEKKEAELPLDSEYDEETYKQTEEHHNAEAEETWEVAEPEIEYQVHCEIEKKDKEELDALWGVFGEQEISDECYWRVES